MTKPRLTPAAARDALIAARAAWSVAGARAEHAAYHAPGLYPAAAAALRAAEAAARAAERAYDALTPADRAAAEALPPPDLLRARRAAEAALA